MLKLVALSFRSCCNQPIQITFSPFSKLQVILTKAIS